jgi:hypothetical protein
MAKLKVHVMNWHGIGFTHINVLLKDMSAEPCGYYLLERWSMSAIDDVPNEIAKQYVNAASTTCTFEIDATPDEIKRGWSNYHCTNEPNIITNNCADATTWFLEHYAKIPSPTFLSAPISFNYLTFGIFIPSFIPIGITLPGRIMSNVEFYTYARNHPELAEQYSKLGLQIGIAISILVVAASITGIIAASICLSGAIATITTAGCSVSGAISTWGLFKAVNTQKAIQILENDKLNVDDETASSLPSSMELWNL